ncbi:hypothetical protein DBV14_26190 [Variovorax sp. KBW07]|uniref:DUF2169 family type VI secretion system accessory protein n=1 Tax=Variovorax sp. KBW07 TaxID=2153358 RepID=UPI000F577A2A|nr:DUF2169 domain-containing protein [Variovorax sp. KBW07]RQO43181.1 hypothetical protein DBV14_26190 [Variovorax sp. KBW07]
MKVFKPTTASLIARNFEFRGKKWFGVSVLMFIELGGERPLRQEMDLWKFWATRPEAKGILEEGCVRGRSEYLVSGSAYPLDAKDDTGCAVEAQVGGLRKALLVRGRRHWDGAHASPPQGFAAMPLDWAHAYGGAEFAENPLGLGAAPVDTPAGRVHWLPNIEDPRAPLAAPADRATPVGFGPIDQMWPQRAAQRGTYDEAWLKQDFPGIANDTDWGFFNIASVDQQQVAPFTGDEPYSFRNMHPAVARLEGRLPGLKARAFVTHRTGGEDKFKELRLQLRTAWFFPDAERAILISQGMHEVAEDDGADIVHLMAAVERLDQPREALHYLAVRDKRLDRKNGTLESLREEDLMPADLVVPLFDPAAFSNRALDRSLQRAEADRAQARADVAALGLDADEHAPPVKGPPTPEVRTIDDLIRLQAEMADEGAKAPARMAAEKAATTEDVRAIFAREKLDFAPIEREMAGLETRGPPKPFAEDLKREFIRQIAHGKALGSDVSEFEDMLGDSKRMAQWAEGDAQQLAGYRMAAHMQPAVDRLPNDAAEALRVRVRAHHAKGLPFTGWDLSGANLAGLDLKGAQLGEALLENANLTGTELGGADLHGAVLAHATLQSTQLDGANLQGANLGGARLSKVNFAGADLGGATFDDARLSDIDMRGARLDGIRLGQAQLGGVDCSGAVCDALLVFVKNDLRGCRFTGARFKQCAFVECDLSGVDFSDAVFGKCGFVGIVAPGAGFRGLRIASGCFAQGCVLTGADFGAAQLPSMNFRGAELSGAHFGNALLNGSDFSECTLQRADFRSAQLREARFVRADMRHANFGAANLWGAVLQHATLEETDFRRANLFRADLARVKVGFNVRFDEALATRMRTYPRHRPAAAAAA